MIGFDSPVIFPKILVFFLSYTCETKIKLRKYHYISLYMYVVFDNTVLKVLLWNSMTIVASSVCKDIFQLVLDYVLYPGTTFEFYLLCRVFIKNPYNV